MPVDRQPQRFGIVNDDVISYGLTLSRAFIAECAENALRKT